MSEKERIMLECRYILSLNKNYYDIAKFMNLNWEIIYDDINVKLPDIDSLLYKKVKKVLNNT